MQTIRMEPPTDLRDMVWTGANITLTNGGEIVALIPSRYPDTAAAGSPAERLARATSWIETSGGAFTGRGQRLLSTDADDYALHDIRMLELTTSGPEAG
jgi:type VI secretion system protein ImpE